MLQPVEIYEGRVGVAPGTTAFRLNGLDGASLLLAEAAPDPTTLQKIESQQERQLKLQTISTVALTSIAVLSVIGFAISHLGGGSGLEGAAAPRRKARR
jgi:hypothetical protein